MSDLNTYEAGSQRNHNDETLMNLLGQMDEGQRKLLVLGGALPLEIAREPNRELMPKDVARMIELEQK